MDCDRCKNQAVYNRKYSGENLCSTCFSSSIVRKTAKTLSKYSPCNAAYVTIALPTNQIVSLLTLFTFLIAAVLEVNRKASTFKRCCR